MKKNRLDLNILIIFLVFFISEPIFAQLGFCQGNSGDPIFTETFGEGLIDAPLPPGTTTYTYANGMNPEDGLYTVTSNTNYFDWLDVDDVTPNDTNGRMLVVNSDFSAGEFYRTEISGLCENTSYEFSSWIVNLAPAGGFCGAGVIPVNVRFEIWDSTDSNLLAIGDTGNIGSTTTPNWQQYALVFQTIPSQTSVILKMINNGIGGCGNDLAIDDIVFKSCGDFISLNDSTGNNEITLCSSQTPFNEMITATPDNTVFSNHFYQWQESSDGITWTDIMGEINPIISISGVTQTTYYRAKVAEFASNLNNDDCITFSDIYTLTVNQAPDPPIIECWEVATFNDTTCSWEISGTQPLEPNGLECWQTTSFNSITCSWEINGTQPTEPVTACWEVTSFNTNTCSWEISGTEPPEPIVECWQTTSFNSNTCSWEISGTQPTEPTGLECWQTASFNDITCSWEVNGAEPIEPTNLECWQTTEFNYNSCSWEINGTQPSEPVTECWETVTFNSSLCVWEISGTQPPEPTGLECWESANFSSISCSWEITGTQIIDFIEEDIAICDDESIIIQANTDINNATYQWSSGQTTSTIAVDSPGTYTVLSTDGCAAIEKTINVIATVTPIIESVVSNGNDIVITTSNSGNFLYSIDGVNYQTSNVFFDTVGGKYLVSVKSEECDTIVTEEHLHFYIPKFFTPNDDTVNDTFNLFGIECFNTSEVNIFDRYGKLLFSAKNRIVAWDGTFNNQPLPSTDYWYLIIIDGQEIRGHFTLRR